MWNPTKEWEGQPAYIIGGGSSLKGFNFDSLKGKHTIGCNDAYRLGPEIVDIAMFGDGSFFQKAKWDLEKFHKKGGRVLSVSPSLANYKLPWMLSMARHNIGLTTHASNEALLAAPWTKLKPRAKVGWNLSTGACAVNVALLLGAVRIYLLGFDMKLNQGKSHWHTHRNAPTIPSCFTRFLRGFQQIADEMHKYPDAAVFNVTDGSSNLHNFTRIPFTELP